MICLVVILRQNHTKDELPQDDNGHRSTSHLPPPSIAHVLHVMALDFDKNVRHVEPISLKRIQMSLKE